MPVFSMIGGPGITFDRFSMPCKRAFAGTVGAEIDMYGNVPGYEETKEQHIDWLGCSYRQWQIDYSEKFMKPLYGKDIFSRLFVERNINKPSRAVVVPDSGFAEEAKPVADAFGLENTLLIRVHRPGCDFSKDSRSYISGISPNEFDVDNDGSFEDYYHKVVVIVADFLARNE
jgi:hypothetical protein